MNIRYFIKRTSWRKWLLENFNTANEIWLAYPKKHTGKPRISYNDAVEEALCFGWIDSKVKSLDADTTVQRFCPRKKPNYSQPNRERIRWLLEQKLVHPSQEATLKKIAAEAFYFPEDILDHLKQDAEVWKNYQNFLAGYQRIRIAYIESARKRPEEFKKRLNNFTTKTRAGKIIRGYGGIEKYY